MLQLFRSGLTSYFATALLGLLIASFALWGIGGDILGGAGNNVAQIGDEKISLNDYAQEFQNKFAQIQQQSDGQVTRDIAIDQGYANRWVTDLVQRETFAYAAHDLNIRVTDTQLRDYITGIEAFQDTFGEFSKSSFESIAGYRGLSSGEFEENLRRELERQYLMNAIISSISVPNTVQQTFVKYLLEERTAELVTVPAFSIKDIPAPDDATLQSYYQENSANYMAPEYRDIRFITLSAKDFSADITVTDEEIEQAMGTASDTANDNEKRDFEQILFDDKESADKAYADLTGGRKFADIILASGSSPDDATVSENSIQDVTDSYGITAAEAVFTAEEGKYTSLVETDFGWRIFNITKISAATNDAGKLRAETIELLKEEKALDLLYEKSELINDELAAGGSLSDIATNLSLELKTALNFDLSGYTSKGDFVADIPADPTFLVKTFETLEGDEPLLEEMGNGEYFLLVVDNIQPTALRPFEEVKTSVVDIWKADARKNMAREKANEIMTKTQDGISMEDISKASSDTAYTSVTLPRNDQTGKVSGAIHNSIFTQDTGSTKILPASDGNGFVVVKLLSRKLPVEAMPVAQTAQLKSLLLREYQQRFLKNYWRHLETSLPVTINSRAVKAVHDQLASREQ